jgi:hypothetical protein
VRLWATRLGCRWSSVDESLRIALLLNSQIAWAHWQNHLSTDNLKVTNFPAHVCEEVLTLLHA